MIRSLIVAVALLMAVPAANACSDCGCVSGVKCKCGKDCKDGRCGPNCPCRKVKCPVSRPCECSKGGKCCCDWSKATVVREGDVTIIIVKHKPCCCGKACKCSKCPYCESWSGWPWSCCCPKCGPKKCKGDKCPCGK